MKKTNSRKVDSLFESIHKKNPKGLLTVDSEFYNYLNQCHVQHLLQDVISEKLSSQRVITDNLAAIQKIIGLAKKDVLNIRKCVAFLRRKFPHVILSSGNFTIGIHNLTENEIEYCLTQKAIKFSYYKG